MAERLLTDRGGSGGPASADALERVDGAGQSSVASPQTFGFLLVPRFSMISFATAIEPLRAANRWSRQPLYHWQLISADGQPVSAGNGCSINVDLGIEQATRISTVIVCGGLDIDRYDDPRVLAWLRRIDRHGGELGALSSGTHVLARAGLLNGHRCVIHWENLASFRATFPEIDVRGELYEIDGQRFTCSGGTSSLDMMLELIRRRHGSRLATQVSEQFIHHRVRQSEEPQRPTLERRLGVYQSTLLALVAQMEANIRTPLSIAELAGRVGITPRQVERLCRRYLGHSPTRHYLSVRIQHARELLTQTSLSVHEVATTCGFNTSSHLARWYGRLLGRSPTRERAERLNAT
jgi:AraC family transcriptional regulator, glycine betaine-responsive activator